MRPRGQNDSDATTSRPAWCHFVSDSVSLWENGKERYLHPSLLPLRGGPAHTDPGLVKSPFHEGGQLWSIEITFKNSPSPAQCSSDWRQRRCYGKQPSAFGVEWLDGGIDSNQWRFCKQEWCGILNKPLIASWRARQKSLIISVYWSKVILSCGRSEKKLLWHFYLMTKSHVTLNSIELS